jgi:hypothetical protein
MDQRSEGPSWWDQSTAAAGQGPDQSMVIDSITTVADDPATSSRLRSTQLMQGPAITQRRAEYRATGVPSAGIPPQPPDTERKRSVMFVKKSVAVLLDAE